MTTASQRQLRAVLPQKGGEAAAAHFLFAFDDEGNIAGQLGAGLEIGFHGFEVGQVLAFVVAGAAPEERAVGDARLEGRRLPQLQRLGRLHVVMPIDHEMRDGARRAIWRAASWRRQSGCPWWGRAAPPGRFPGNASRPTPRRPANPGGVAAGRKRWESARTRRVRRWSGTCSASGNQ